MVVEKYESAFELKKSLCVKDVQSSLVNTRHNQSAGTRSPTRMSILIGRMWHENEGMNVSNDTRQGNVYQELNGQECIVCSEEAEKSRFGDEEKSNEVTVYVISVYRAK